MSDMDVVSLSLDEVIEQKRRNNSSKREGGRQRRDGGVQKRKRRSKKRGNDKFVEAIRSSSGGKAVAHLSNLPFSVIQEDLEELFYEYRLRRVSLHYDYRGKSLGNAELHGSPAILSRIARDFESAEIDGRPLHISVVGEGSSSGGGLRSRVQRIGGGGDKRTSGSSRKRGSRGSRRKGRDDSRNKLTPAELDKELDAYMAGRKNG